MKLIANISTMIYHLQNSFSNTLSVALLSIPTASTFISMTFKYLSLVQAVICYRILTFCPQYFLSLSCPHTTFGLILTSQDYYVTSLSKITPSCSFKRRKHIFLSTQTIIVSILTNPQKSSHQIICQLLLRPPRVLLLWSPEQVHRVLALAQV